LRRSPAQNYALVIGFALTFAGALGFAYSAAFGSPGHTGSVLGTLEVNGWHNVVHIATGVLGLFVAGSYSAARRYCIGLAAVYTVVAIWGFVLGDHHSILGFIPVNTEDSFLHAFIAVVGCVAGLATPAAPAPTARGGEPRPRVRFD
jgi:hypothetical protein